MGDKLKEVGGWGGATTGGLAVRCLDFDIYPRATAGFERRSGMIWPV